MRTITRYAVGTLALVFASQLVAQTGGGSRGGSGTSPPSAGAARTPSAAASASSSRQPYPQGDQRFSVAWYLNHGDYASAAQLQYLHEHFALIDAGSWNGNPAVSLGDFLGVPYASEEDLDQFRAMQGRELQSVELPPATTGSQRPSSMLEGGQTATIVDFEGFSRQRATAAQALLREARASGDQSLINRAQTLASNSAVVNRDIALINDMAGRYSNGFPDESTALTYMAARSRVLDAIQVDTTPFIGANGRPQTFAEVALEVDRALEPRRNEAGRNQNPAVFPALAQIPERLVTQATRFQNPGGHYDDVVLQIENTAARAGNQNSRDPVLAPGTAANLRAAQQRAANANAARSRENDEAVARVLATRQRNEAAYGNTEAEQEAARQSASREVPEPPVEDNTPPRAVPTAPDYPTVSAEERARISREAAARRVAERAAADQAATAQRAAQEAAAREAAERAAMVERSRIADENHRLYEVARRQALQDDRWRQMVDDRFRNSAWDAFADGRTVTTLELEAIYANYDPLRAIPPARSLSAAGMSLSAAGWSLSLAGLDYRDPAVASLNEVLYGVGQYRHNAFGSTDGDPARAAQMAYNAGSFDVRYNRDNRENFDSGGYVAANLFSYEDPYLRQLMNNGRTGLDRLLAQPFNVILTWGENANDLDLHMTGSLGEGLTDRFHIYFGARGDLEAQPYASLIKDCICTSGSEVVLTSALNSGGVYRVSVFNYGDQAAGSSNLSNASNAQIQIVRGGTTESVGNGTTIVGGRTIMTTSVPNGGTGNTWVAVELDPKNGRITVPRIINQSPGSGEVP